MKMRNTHSSFGLVTRGLHWMMAVALIAMLAFGTYLARMEPALDTLWMYGAHKSVGIALLFLLVLRFSWHLWSVPPGPIPDGAEWGMSLARFVHRMLYLLMLAMPLSGWAASSATGIDTVLFNRWVLPPIAPVSERLETLGFAVHGALSKLFLILILIHVAGALRHRNGTLRRMWRGRV